MQIKKIKIAFVSMECPMITLYPMQAKKPMLAKSIMKDITRIDDVFPFSSRRACILPPKKGGDFLPALSTTLTYVSVR
jgi:hypothetical protein